MTDKFISETFESKIQKNSAGKKKIGEILQ